MSTTNRMQYLTIMIHFFFFQQTKPLLPAQPKLNVLEFGKNSETLDVSGCITLFPVFIITKFQDNQAKEFELIRLIISENRSLLTYNTNDRIRVSRTKPNEFKVMDNIYYYRSNDQFKKNYFFMNIVR